MKIRILSDLHLEGQNFVYIPLDEDVVVLAGDISSRPELYQRLKESIEVPIVIVPGNHEFYGKNYDDHLPLLKEMGYSHNEIVKVNDVNFICSTLWTNFSLFGPQEAWFVEKAAAS